MTIIPQKCRACRCIRSGGSTLALSFLAAEVTLWLFGATGGVITLFLSVSICSDLLCVSPAFLHRYLDRSGKAAYLLNFPPQAKLVITLLAAMVPQRSIIIWGSLTAPGSVMVTGIANWLVAERAARNTSSGQTDLIEFLRRRGKNKIKKLGFALPRCPAR